jgi:PKHD-type hydroxylase
MKGEWCYFKSYFDKTTCERIINDALVLPAQDGLVGINGQEGLDIQGRRSKIRFISKDNQNFQWLFDHIWKTAISANNDFFNIHFTKLDFIQFAEYDASYQGEYREHQDVFWLNNDPIYHRKLSGIIQLSDPTTYEGGNFEILETAQPPVDDLRMQGTVFYFPSFFKHRANQVIRGTRYSIAVWFEGPKWR